MVIVKHRSIMLALEEIENIAKIVFSTSKANQFELEVRGVYIRWFA